jgi:hypothetical protein
MNLALSLVSIPSLSRQEIDELGGVEEFKSFALSPAHFSTTFDAATPAQIQKRCNEFTDTGIEVSSFQGLFFGIDQFTEHKIKERVEKLVLASLSVNCGTWVLGGPYLRKSEEVWNCVLRELRRVESTYEIKISLENICVKPCDSQINHTFKDYEKFQSLTLDYANTLDCESISLEKFITIDRVDHVHLSGKKHSSDLQEFELCAIGEILENIKPSLLTIELSTSGLKELLVDAGELQNQIQNGIHSQSE